MIDESEGKREGKRWLKTDEAAEYSSLSLRRTRQLIHNGVVPAAYSGGYYLVDRRALDAWLEKQAKQFHRDRGDPQFNGPDFP